MAVELHLPGYEQATKLVKEGQVVLDDRADWDKHRPSIEQENDFIAKHGWDEYGRWFLGVDDEHGPETKARYKFPYGDFAKVHKCAVLSAEIRAAQYNYEDIEVAAAHLHGMLSR